LDINKNPNAPTDVSVTELLPSAELAVAHGMGNHLQIYGGLWGQFWTQNPSSSQYKTFENYSPSSDDFDRLWLNMYSDGLKDLQTIVDKATALNLPNYVACAKILQAYTYQVLTDNFGDIPFSQSLKEEAGVLTPAYDTQHDIYHGLIALTKSGLASIDESAGAITPGGEDLLLHGDMGLWRKFGNTLLLRIYLRLAYRDAGEAQAGIVELDSSNAEFLGAGDEVRIDYTTAGGNTNPAYSSIVDLGRVQNLVASATAVDYMVTNGDPRVEVFYTLAANGSYAGIPQGDYTLPAGTPVSLPGYATGANGDEDSASVTARAPVKLMTGYESLFLQAEAVERGWLTGVGSAQTLYEDAITANFVSYGVSDTLAPLYYAQPGIDYALATDKIEAIITQKWISMCGNQNDEAWIEWRRTGFPSFFTISVETVIGPSFPQRFYYPSIEVTRNPNTPNQLPITNKVWWDVN
jgi:hypothetical protein